MEVIIDYYGDDIAVSKEVADYLKSDRKRHLAERKRDNRHLSMYNYERELDLYSFKNRCDIADIVIKNLEIESLHEALRNLSFEDNMLIYMRFWEEYTLEAIGKQFGISKVAVHKRLNKLMEKLKGELSGEPFGFFFFVCINIFVYMVNKRLMSVLYK